MKIKMLKAEKRYGLKRGEGLEVRLVKREPRYTIFLEPPMRHLNLYNEDWREVMDAPNQSKNIQRRERPIPD